MVVSVVVSFKSPPNEDGLNVVFIFPPVSNKYLPNIISENQKKK